MSLFIHNDFLKNKEKIKIKKKQNKYVSGQEVVVS